MSVDTSAEAVERRIRELQGAGFDNGAATLLALLAERDDFVRRETCDITNDLRDANDKLATVEAERDRLAAEVERLQKALRPFASPMMDRVQTDVRTAHQLRGNGASEAMHDDDCDLRVALRKAVGVARAALAGEGR